MLWKRGLSASKFRFVWNEFVSSNQTSGRGFVFPFAIKQKTQNVKILQLNDVRYQNKSAN